MQAIITLLDKYNRSSSERFERLDKIISQINFDISFNCFQIYWTSALKEPIKLLFAIF